MLLGRASRSLTYTGRLLNPTSSEQPPSPPILEAQNIRKSFGAIQALKGVSFDVRAGEVHALVGANGAGKSTLIKILAGALNADSGEILLRGHTVEANTPAKARALGISVIYQQPALFPDLTVAENLAFAREVQKPWRRVNWRALRQRASALLEKAGANISPDRLASSLSMPEQQQVEIAKAIDADAQILILDEPTASLGGQDAERLFRLLDEFRARGVGIVYISHRFEELFRLADRVTVLRDGTSVETSPMQEMTSAQLIRLMAGRDLDTVFPKRAAAFGPPAFEVRGLVARQSGVRAATFTIRRGEILGLAGLVGSGRTGLAESLFGLAPIDAGEVSLDGAPLNVREPSDSIQAGLAYVPEDRRKHGVILDLSVAANTTLASLRKISNSAHLLNEAEERRLTDNAIAEFGIKTPSAGAPVRNLSGGNQQKVALARWLLTDPKVLILDEPTQGVDVAAKSEIYRLIANLAEQGLAILLISSETPEILGLSDRIAVMAQGEILGIVDREAATPEILLAMSLGHSSKAQPQS